MMKLLSILMLSLLISKTALAQSSVTLVADYDHSGDGARSSAIAIGQQFSGGRKCFFVEVPPDFNRPMRAYMSGRASYSATVGTAIARYQRSIGYEFQNVVPARFLDAASQMQAQVIGVDFAQGSATERSVRNIWRQISPYLTDLERAPRPLLVKFLKMLEARNAIMASNTARALRAGTCQEAVLIVGEGHLREHVLDIRIRSLQSDLARRGISTQY